MNPKPCTLYTFVLLALLPVMFAASAPAQGLQLISRPDPLKGSIASGGGDSWGATLNPDGRFVLFASTANNLLLMTNNNPMPARIPAFLNVFLRDRNSGTTSLVSVNTSGVAGGNGDSLPMEISPDGRFALFESSASDLVPGDTNNASDVFVRDLVDGTMILVSANTNGVPGKGVSRTATMTPDGHFVAFVSTANDLVAGDSNRIADVFVRDLQAQTTTLASAGAISTMLTGNSDTPQITPDGRYVGFFSTATNLVNGVPPGGDVYVRDLANQTTLWASMGARAATFSLGRSSNAVSYNFRLSDDGQYVAYEASSSVNLGATYPGTILRFNMGNQATELVHTNASVTTSSFEDISTLDMTPDGRFIAYVANTNNVSTTCVLLWDATSGVSTLVSGDMANTVPAASICDWPAVTPDGRYVSFLSSAAGLATNTVLAGYHVYVRDTQAGVTALVDADATGVGAGVSALTKSSMSADGRLVAFDCQDANLVTNDRNHASDIFVRNLPLGVAELISAHDPSLPSITPNGSSTLAVTSVSADGRYVAFASEADDLAANDANGCRDVFLRDLVSGTTALVSVDTNGFSGDSVSFDPAISGDGGLVAFSSSADNLVPGDANKAQDVFVRDLTTGVTRLVSMPSTGMGTGNGASYSPLLSANGRFVLFRSRATNLAPGSYVSATENLFLRDLQAGTTRALTTAGLNAASMTPDGDFVAFIDTPGSTVGRIYVWDTQAAKSTTNFTSTPVVSVAISANGNRLAYWTGSSSMQLSVADRATKTNWVIASGGVGVPVARPALRFSSNSEVLAFNAGVTNQIYIYDLRTGVAALVSHAHDSASSANGSSDSPDISADGRFVTYRSSGSDIVPGDANELPDIFLYDRQTDQNALLSSGRFGGGSADNRSLTPVFSGDGRTLVFQSWASDLLPGDFNANSDLFATTLLYAAILPDVPAGKGPWLSWPWMPGTSYRVEFKNSLSDAVWQQLSGTITNAGMKAYLQDPNPAPGQRFYRVVTF